MAIGLASNLSPMYIAEVAPAQMRGRLVSINQLTIVIGILLAQIINWWLVPQSAAGRDRRVHPQLLVRPAGWRWMFGLTAVPSLLFFVGMFWCRKARAGWPRTAGPSAPARSGEDRRRDLCRRRAGGNRVHAGGDEIAAGAISANCCEPSMRKVLVLGVVLAVFQQWCGINVIFNYAEEIFHAAGYDISAVLKNIAWTGSVNLAFTFVALGMVDRGGRRPLMLFGSAGWRSSISRWDFVTLASRDCRCCCWCWRRSLLTRCRSRR